MKSYAEVIQDMPPALRAEVRRREISRVGQLFTLEEHMATYGPLFGLHRQLLPNGQERWRLQDQPDALGVWVSSAHATCVFLDERDARLHVWKDYKERKRNEAYARIYGLPEIASFHTDAQTF